MLGRGWTYLLGCWLVLGLGCNKMTECPDNSPGNSLTSVPNGFPEIPFPEDNQFTEARWELGKKLFYDPVMSVDSSLSCASCHHPQLAFADDRAFSSGVAGAPGRRNAPSLANVAYHPRYLREGSLPTLEMQVLVPIQEENEFHHNIVDLAVDLANDPTYVAMSQAAYERDPDPFVITRALSTFERTLISGNSPYDRWYYQGCGEAMEEAEVRGRDLFYSERTQCGTCHGGFNFTNYGFENNGLYVEYDDPGRFRFTGDSTDIARFKVPSLRNVAVTAPYMHDGSFQSLEQVVEHYNSGGQSHANQNVLVRPLGLSDAEMADLVAFLRALTDEEFLQDTRFSP